MARSWNPSASVNRRAAALLGLISSTFSTVVSQLAAARIGRDATVDWMLVAAVPLRDWALQVEPPWGIALVGILFHQWAGFSWAVAFFGPLGRWTAGLRPWTILLAALPWAALTSAAEWLFLVPLAPFRQPIFALEQAYRMGLVVHLASSSMYPLFPWLRDRVAVRRRPPPHRRFAAAWRGLAGAGAATLGALAFLGWQGREPPHVGGGGTRGGRRARRPRPATRAGDAGGPRRHAGHGPAAAGGGTAARRWGGLRPALRPAHVGAPRGAIAMAEEAIERAGDPRA